MNYSQAFPETMWLSGYAKDLGLYMPEELPVIGLDELQHLRACSFPELVCKIARKFIDEAEIPTTDLEGEDFVFFCMCFYRFIYLLYLGKKYHCIQPLSST